MAVAADVDAQRLPQHVAIIMDGNGRWAQCRGLPRTAGHRAGMETVRRVVRCADDWGIRVLTLFAFSTENWRRPVTEVAYLMRLPGEYLRSEMDELMARGIRIQMLGDRVGVPALTLRAVERGVVQTAANPGMVLNFAFNYGGRAELVRTVRSIAKEVKNGQLSPETIDEQTIADHLDTRGLPDPDLLIRTSGEQRLSNYLLWQLAYSELLFVPKFWPDFSEMDFEMAMREFQHRQRRFGGVSVSNNG
ncbi:MAG: isoprenyl transferase [Firmicutes bacterium]|nr:isoprenyl transferase [Bacillota bacterium]